MFSSSPVFNTLIEQLLQSSFFKGKVLCLDHSSQSYIKTATGSFHGCGLGKKPFTTLCCSSSAFFVSAFLSPSPDRGSSCNVNVHTHRQWRKVGEWMNVSTSWYHPLIGGCEARENLLTDLPNESVHSIATLVELFGFNSMWIFNL